MKTSKVRYSLILLFIAVFFACVFCGFVFSEQNAEAQESGNNFTNLIVHARFYGEDEFLNDECGGSKVTVKEVTENCYEKADYNVKDYYERTSNGKVKMQNLFLFDKNGQSITLSNPRGYYCTKSSDNEIGYEPGEYSLRMYELKRDWTNAIVTAFNEGGFITDGGNRRYGVSDLDKNGDGVIDGLTIIYKYSSLYSVAWSDCLWNYQDFYDGITLQDGQASVTSGAYFQMTANYGYLYSDSRGTKFVSLKTMIHETGHIFGLKDLYRSSSVSRVYYMSAMSNALSPVPQYISAKEREALGWLDEGNIRNITTPGTYTIGLTADIPSNDVICYKIDLIGTDKTAYLEYRRFDSAANRYDNQTKTIFNADGNLAKGVTLKSGLVCFLADRDTKFPNNLNTSGNRWNYEVLGGTYSTKSDAALSENDSLYLSAKVEVQVLSVSESSLSFRITGDGIDGGHIHSAQKTAYAAPTCTKSGNTEYYYCAGCNTYFSDEALTRSIALKDTVISPLGHKKVTVYGFAPTCKKTGLTDWEKCSTCDEILTEQVKLSVIPHVPSEWIIDKPATESEDGLRHKECTSCKDVLETSKITYEKPSGGTTPPDNQKPPDENGSTDGGETPDPPNNGSSPDSGNDEPPTPPSNGNENEPNGTPDGGEPDDDSGTPPITDKPNDGIPDGNVPPDGDTNSSGDPPNVPPATDTDSTIKPEASGQTPDSPVVGCSADLRTNGATAFLVLMLTALSTIKIRRSLHAKRA